MLNRLLDRLDRKFGRYAIRNLMTYIVTANFAVFLLQYLVPALNLKMKLMFIPSMVLKGEVWRLITFIFIPPQSSVIFIIFVLYFYYMIGSSLEHEWGSFKFNVYYLVGIIVTAAAAMFTGASDATYLNLSLFLAFAYLFPNFEILLFFFLPIKVKYLAWLSWAFIAVTVIFGAVPSKLAAVVSLGNYFLFFGRDYFKNIKKRKAVYYNRKNFHAQIQEGIQANRENMKNRK